MVGKGQEGFAGSNPYVAGTLGQLRVPFANFQPSPLGRLSVNYNS